MNPGSSSIGSNGVASIEIKIEGVTTFNSKLFSISLLTSSVTLILRAFANETLGQDRASFSRINRFPIQYWKIFSIGNRSINKFTYRKDTDFLITFSTLVRNHYRLSSCLKTSHTILLFTNQSILYLLGIGFILLLALIDKEIPP